MEISESMALRKVDVQVCVLSGLNCGIPGQQLHAEPDLQGTSEAKHVYKTIYLTAIRTKDVMS